VIRWRSAVTAALLSLALFAPGVTSVRAEQDRPRSFRMFSLGYYQRMENARTYETWTESVEKRFEQIAALFVNDRPNVVLLPEALGLTAWLIGPRGEQSRKEGNTAETAIASLATTYAPQVSYYETKCQTTAARALVLALTDTSWRAFGETLARLAKKHNAYVVATHDMAIPKKVTDPAKVALLGDPDADTSYAYEASSCDAYNAAFFFGPDGEVFTDKGDMAIGTDGAQVRGWVPKAYLVPIERERTLGLSLASGSPAQVRPVDLGFASFGIFTSKDAWMSDLPNRNDVDGAEIFVQPEAGPWAGWNDSGVKDWQQDGIKRAFWSFVQKLPTTRWGAVTNLIGNFHTLPFDGTPTIATDAPDFRVNRRGPKNKRHYLLGQRVSDGIVARSEWVVHDPGRDIRFRDIEKRRDYLQAQGEMRAPGGKKENEYRPNALVWTDVTLPARPPSAARGEMGPFGESVEIAPSEAVQWEPSLTTRPDGTVVAAWTDLRQGDEDAFVGVRASGKWSEPIDLVEGDDRPNDQQDNQYGIVVAAPRAKGSNVHAAWLDFRNQSWDVRAERVELDQTSDSDDRRVDHSKTSAEGYPRENLHNDVDLEFLGDEMVVAAWSDLRRRNVDRDIRVAALKTRSDDAEWEGDGRPLRRDGADQFHPSLELDGKRAWVAWQDHRHGDADIRVAVSKPSTFTRPLRVDDGPRNTDAFMPSLGVRRGAALVAWSDDRSGVYQVRVAAGTRDGFGRSVPVAPTSQHQSHPVVTAAGEGRWLVAWTDHRAGDTDVMLAPVEVRGTRAVAGAAVRVDDSGTSDARLPALAIAKGRVWIAWEDLRSGVEQIRVVSTGVRGLFR